MPCPILLIDDHPLLRAGLRLMLESALANALVLEVDSIGEAVRCGEAAPALVLLDIELPGLNGLDGLGVLRQRWPQTPVVVLTSHAEREVQQAALAGGAWAFLSKAASMDEMMAAIRAALNREPAAGVSGKAAQPGRRPHLTPRQCEVLDQLCLGYSNKVISRHLGLSENTVRVHVQALFTALDVSSRTQAVVAARHHGLVR